jgi:hypothetical protein
MGNAYVLLSFFICLLCALLVHELGHLLTGWIVGFHFGSIDVGPVSLISEYGRLKVRARREMLVGGSVSVQIGPLLNHPPVAPVPGVLSCRPTPEVEKR